VLALDTNILVRFVLADDEAQHAAAVAVMMSPSLFIAATVLLELSWLLLNTYAYPRRRVLEVLNALAALPNVTVDRAAQVQQALAWTGEGMDFADALHLASAHACEALVSFDRDFGRRARVLETTPPVRAP
jgi:predicted nucleic-acid-binding protein